MYLKVRIRGKYAHFNVRSYPIISGNIKQSLGFRRYLPEGCKIYNFLQDLELLPKGSQKKELTTCMAQGGRKQSQGPRM